MAQYIENVDIVANVKTTADTSGLTGDIKKVLEKPFKLELEADAKGLFNDIRKDIGKIEQVVSKMDFGNLSQNLAQAIQVGAIQGSKSVEETLVDLKIQQEKIKKSQIAQAKEIGVQQYDKLVADIQNTFKDQATLDKQLKKIEGFKERISKWDTYTGIENWQAALLKNVQGSPDLEKLVKNMNKRINLSNENAWKDSNKELDNLKEYYTALDSVHVKPTINISGLNEALNKLQNFKQLMDQILIDGGNTSFGSAMQGMYNVSDELHRAFTKSSSSDSMYLNVAGVHAMKASLASLNKAIGEFGDTSKFKNLQEILEHLATTVSSLADSFKVMADNSMKSSSFYEKQIEQETTKLQSINEELDEQIRKREQIQDLVNTTSQTDSGKNKHSDEFLQIQAAMNYYNHVAKEMSEIQEDIKQFEQEANDSNNENQIQAKQDLEKTKQRLERYKTIQVSPDETLFNDKKLGQGALNKAKQGVALLREFMKAGGNIEDLDIKGLDKNSAIYELLSADSDVTKAETNRNNNITNRTESLDKIKGYEKQLELARIAESANQPQDSADTTPLDLKVDEFNAALDSTSSHFERLNTAISDTTNGLNKQDEKDGDQRIPNRLKQYAMTPGEFANIHSTIENNAIDLFENSNYDDMDLSVEQMANGLAKVSANLRDSTGEWKKFTAIADRAGNIIETKFKMVKPDAQTKLEESWQKSRKIDTQDTEKELLSVSEQLEQAELIRDSLGLEDSSKWSVTVDERGFVTIKDNLLEVEDATVQATRKFNDFNEAIDKFESSAKNITLSNQKKTTGGTDEISTDFINDILKSTKENYKQDYIQQISTLKAYKDKGLYNVDDYRDVVSDGYLAINKMFSLSKDKTYITDFSNDELAQMINLYERLQNAVKQAGNAAQKAQDNFGKLMDASKLNTEATKMLKYLDSNTNAAEKYGDTIRNLAEQMRNAITDKDFKRIQEEFTNIQYKIQSEGLTGKSSGLTVSDASIKKISSDISSKSLLNDINKVKNSYESLLNMGKDLGDLGKHVSQIDNLFQSIDTSTLNKIDAGVADVDDINTLVSTYNELSSVLKEAKSEITALTREHGRFIDENERLTASNNMLKWLENNSRASKQYGEQIETLAAQMRSVTTETEFKSINSQFKSITSKAASEGLLGRSIWDSFKNTFSHISEIFGSYSIVDIFQDLGREGVENIRLIDASLTDLQMSAGLAKNEAKELMETYGQLGDDMAILSTDLASATTSWIKQGESLENATKLAQDSTVLSVLGEMETEDAATYLTSALKGYQLASDQAMDVVDKISTVDIMSATSVGGLAEGMSEVATQANLVGISFDELLGYLAAIGEVTQDDMGSVGGALNTIFARMGNIKLGRLKDYQNDLETDLSNVETVLRGEGIDLRDEMGQFRDFNDVLDETAARWDSFSSISQNAIAQAFAGTHRRESFLVLMQNYQKAQQYAEAAAESSGSAEQRYSIYIDSLSGKYFACVY